MKDYYTCIRSTRGMKAWRYAPIAATNWHANISRIFLLFLWSCFPICWLLRQRVGVGGNETQHFFHSASILQKFVAGKLSDSPIRQDFAIGASATRVQKIRIAFYRLSKYEEYVSENIGKKKTGKEREKKREQRKKRETYLLSRNFYIFFHR